MAQMCICFVEFWIYFRNYESDRFVPLVKAHTTAAVKFDRSEINRRKYARPSKQSTHSHSLRRRLLIVMDRNHECVRRNAANEMEKERREKKYYRNWLQLSLMIQLELKPAISCLCNGKNFFWKIVKVWPESDANKLICLFLRFRTFLSPFFTLQSAMTNAATGIAADLISLFCDWLITFPNEKKKTENNVREYEFYAGVCIWMVVIVTPAILVRQACDTITQTARQKSLRRVRTSWSISDCWHLQAMCLTEFGIGIEHVNGVAKKFARFVPTRRGSLNLIYKLCQWKCTEWGRTKWCTH